MIEYSEEIARLVVDVAREARVAALTEAADTIRNLAATPPP